MGDPNCKTLEVFAFRGDRSKAFVSAFLKSLDQAKRGLGPGPNPIEYLLYAGHTGVSIDGGSVIYGFNPNGFGITVWDLFDHMKNGNACPGVVRDDTGIFKAARRHGLAVSSFVVILPEPHFQAFKDRIDEERFSSQYTYGFPNGDGDCNCVTWLERLALPLLSGRMDEFIALPTILAIPSR